MGKRLHIGVSIGLGALAVAAPAQADHQYSDVVRCASKTVHAAQIVASSSEATAFRKVKRDAQGRTLFRTYACMRRSGPILFLKGSEFSRAAVEPRLAGRFVAFRRMDEINEFARTSGLVVADMSTGAVRFETSRGEAHVDSFVVKRNGSAAWLDHDYESGHMVISKVDETTGGSPVLVDQGSIRQQSLRLSVDRRDVLWTRNGSQRSAPIH
jgi:hypothetical protein